MPGRTDDAAGKFHNRDSCVLAFHRDATVCPHHGYGPGLASDPEHYIEHVWR